MIDSVCEYNIDKIDIVNKLYRKKLYARLPAVIVSKKNSN